MKLDTQGFDLRVVGGAGARISEILALQTEIAAFHFYDGMTSIGDALNRYRNLGFAITGMYPVARKLDGLQVIEFDCINVSAGRSVIISGCPCSRPPTRKSCANRSAR